MKIYHIIMKVSEKMNNANDANKIKMDLIKNMNP